MGRVSYFHIFIPAFAELFEPFQKLLNKDVSFRCGEEQQAAFQKVKDVISSS